MLALIRLFWDICTFRRGPQDVPYSPFIFTVLLIINLSLGLVSLFIPDNRGETHSLSQILPFLVVATLMTIFYVILVLWAHGHVARTLQTLTTMFATDTLLGIVQLPFSFLAAVAGKQMMLILIFYLGMMGLLMWQLAVYTHIFRQALSASVFRGGSYALILFVLSIMIQAMMLPVHR